MENYFIKDHIGIFDGFYSPEFCNDVIKFFEYRKNFQYRFTRDGSLQQDESISLRHEQDFVASQQVQEDEFNILDGRRLIEFFSDIFWNKCYSLYLKSYPHNDLMAKLDFNVFKVQKTMPSQGYHVFHFENADHLTARRAMFFILYLNDIKSGGETEFLYQSQRVEPVTGRLIIAPAAFTHVHRGNPPLKDTKYILTSWLEYTNQFSPAVKM